jgi:hypothetical protein
MALENNVNTATGTFAAAGTVSTAINLAPFCPCGILTDANWTAESISLLGSIDGTNFFPVVGAAGALFSGNLAASSYLSFDPSPLRGLCAIKIVSAVAQTNNTTLTVTSVPVI